MKTSSFLAMLFMAFLTACDYVSEPIAPGTVTNNTGETVKRRALLEEFTGHRCNNCPASHAVALQLATLYGEEVIPVGIHAIANPNSSFITPASPPNADGSYATDFRTPAGAAYATTFSVNFLPTGMVNRTSFDNSVTLSSASWGSAIADIVAQDALCDLWVDTIIHNAGANTVTATVKVAVLGTITGAHNLTVYLTQDSVIDWQLNSLATPPDVPDYVHRHVLRKTLGDTWGEPLIPASAQTGDTLTYTYTGVSMDPAWNAAHCALVAYLYSTSTNEVLQAGERHF